MRPGLARRPNFPVNFQACSRGLRVLIFACNCPLLCALCTEIGFMRSSLMTNALYPVIRLLWIHLYLGIYKILRVFERWRGSSATRDLSFLRGNLYSRQVEEYFHQRKSQDVLRLHGARRQTVHTRGMRKDVGKYFDGASLRAVERKWRSDVFHVQ